MWWFRASAARVIALQADPDITALSTVTEFLSEQLASIGEGQWSVATPCDDWDLRALVDHVAGGNWFTLAVLSGATAVDSLDRARAQFAAGSPTVAQATVSSSDQLAAFRAPDVLEGIWHHVAGELTGREVLRPRLHDLIVHAWDISQSLESAAEIPPELVLWGLAEIGSEKSMAVRHFGIDASQLSAADHSAIGYLGLFDRMS